MNITLSNGENLSYVKRDGGERVLLLIHGNMASSVQWDLLLEEMDPAFTIYAVDLRGYGKSSYHQPIDTIKDFSDDIKQLVDQLDLRKVCLMGWSNGGGVAMQFAADYPEHVDKIVLLSSMSTRGYPAFQTNGERIHSRDQIVTDSGLNMMVEAQQNNNQAFFKAAMDQVLYSVNQPTEEQYQTYLEAATQQRNTLDAAHAANVFNISTVSNGVVDGTGDIQNICAPILVIWGSHDLIVSEEMTLEIIEDFRQAGINFRYAPIDAGHALLVDNVEAVLEETYKFINIA
ncbi:intracellular short-chain-length polyhydroxyalkanoate depolymerase [Gracilibacillus alcaliphilus]|uniref:intracellular short-chain-length polyhydroxyalkanoate depolymerase n=1 Tax=Gracilibacillus alcaliphilus TaxID=1401441 RepID=UPI001957B0AE|nr:alpha/beta hydrolase [Gracilibacillus alcaliphilus]MBM7675744.1 pimeloyl-ACP methyl ester carboxylesterase [Gracilibacillus alcaliphilus]